MPQLCPRVDAVITAGAKALLCKHARVRLLSRTVIYGKSKRDSRDWTINSFFFAHDEICATHVMRAFNRNSRCIIPQPFRTSCNAAVCRYDDFSKFHNGVRLTFHIRRLMANFRKLSGSSKKFFKAHPTNLSNDAWNIRPWYSWKSYIHQYLGTRTAIMPFQMRKKENRPSASKPPNWSLYLKAAELVLLFQSRRIALVGSSATKWYRLF